MTHLIDRVASHDQVVNDDTVPANGGVHAALQIETAIVREGWPIGSVIGSERTLRTQFGLGHRVAREAIRILQSRHAIQSRRGPRGGLVVVSPSQSLTVNVIADYLSGLGVRDDELDEAQVLLESMKAVERDFRAQDPAAPDDNDALAEDHRVANLFLAAIEAVRGRSAGGSGTSAQTCDASTTSAEFESRPVTIANDLLTHLRGSSAALQSEWLGTEQDLCVRYSVGRVVLRQALRILEARGVTRTHRGRSGGIQLRAPQARGALEAALSYLSAAPLKNHEILAWATVFGERINALAVERWSDTEEARLKSCIAGAGHPDEQLPMLLVRLEWDACRNSVLALIARSIAVYHFRFVPDTYHATDREWQRLRDLLVVRTHAISRGDPNTAREAFRDGNYILAQMFQRSLRESSVES
jgi:DNA-binding FadR family transcriptional regulator